MNEVLVSLVPHQDCMGTETRTLDQPRDLSLASYTPADGQRPLIDPQMADRGSAIMPDYRD